MDLILECSMDQIRKPPSCSKVKKGDLISPIERLERIVKDHGEVNSLLGGFRINVLQPTSFPWYDVINELIEIGQEVWINKVEGSIRINSKPEVW